MLLVNVPTILENKISLNGDHLVLFVFYILQRGKVPPQPTCLQLLPGTQSVPWSPRSRGGWSGSRSSTQFRNFKNNTRNSTCFMTKKQLMAPFMIHIYSCRVSTVFSWKMTGYSKGTNNIFFLKITHVLTI